MVVIKLDFNNSINLILKTDIEREEKGGRERGREEWRDGGRGRWGEGQRDGGMEGWRDGRRGRGQGGEREKEVSMRARYVDITTNLCTLHAYQAGKLHHCHRMLQSQPEFPWWPPV